MSWKNSVEQGHFDTFNFTISPSNQKTMQILSLTLKMQMFTWRIEQKGFSRLCLIKNFASTFFCDIWSFEQVQVNRLGKNVWPFNVNMAQTTLQLEYL